jgi:hypothetical protein
MPEDKKERKRFSTFYISKERHHRANPRIWGANRSRGLLWGHCGEKPIADSDLRRCDRCTMYLASSSQACALGSAISAAVLAGSGKGGHGDFHSAQQAMTSLKPVSYSPEPENQAIYNQLYALYRKLHDAFGGISKCIDLSGVMKELMRIKEEAGTLLANRGQNP